ncbi:MAG: sulfite exporter TauE/SafE family protein [Lentisphaeria bacterium]|nr:sulfite exporter TauE/SafE family protein [Lentisphaeria bacterium]
MFPELTYLQAALGAAIVLFCSLLQAAIGFGFSLFAVPLLMMSLGLPLPYIVTIALTASTAQRCVTVTKLHRSVGWRELWPMIGIGILALPAGLFLLRLISGQSQAVTRQCVGLLILLAMGMRLAFRTEPRKHIWRGWGLIASFLGGILNGFANIGGPPMVLWLYAHDWPRDRLRATILSWSLPMVPFQMTLLLWSFGEDILRSALLAACYLPLSFAGSFLGLSLGKRVDERQLRIIATALLILIGLYNVLHPFFHH